MFKSVADDKLVLWNGRSLRDLSQRLQRVESKLGLRSRPGSISKANTFVMVVNDSGENWDRGRVVGIGDALVKPGDVADDLAYTYQNVFERTETDETTVKFGIAASATPDTMLAKVIVSGFAKNAIINVTNLDHEYAKTTTEDGKLDSTSEPTSIRIMFANAVGTSELCKVLLGAPVDSGIFPVELDQVGGDDGSSTQQASWRYNVRALGSSVILKANENPGILPHHYRRPNLGKMTKATFGTALYSGSELIVVSTNEVSVFSTC